MFTSIKRFFKGRGRDRTKREELLEQQRAAEHFRDVVGVAWKLDFPVFVNIQVNGVEATVCLRGREDALLETLYNFAAGQALRFQAEAGEPAPLSRREKRDKEWAEWVIGKRWVPDQYGGLDENAEPYYTPGYWVDGDGKRVERP
jgi:hypothetical protein